MTSSLMTHLLLLVLLLVCCACVALQASGTGGSVIMGASNSADIVTAITKGLSNMLFNIRPTVLPGCPANITFTPEVVTSVGVARVSPWQHSLFAIYGR